MRLFNLVMATSVLLASSSSFAAERRISEAQKDVDCVLSQITPDKQLDYGARFLPDANRTEEQAKSAVEAVSRVLGPAAIACAQKGKWKDTRFERVAFNSFGLMTSKAVMARATAAKFDLPAIQALFDKLPKAQRLNLFSDLLPMAESEGVVSKITTDLKKQFPNETRYEGDRALLKLVVKSMVLANRVQQNLGSFR